MSALLHRLVRLIDLLSEIAGKLAAWMFFAVGLFVTFEVFMRYVLVAPTIWVDEVSRIFQVWGAYLAIAYVLKHKSHIFIDVTFRSPGPARRLVDSFALLVVIFFCAVTVKYGIDVWWKSTRLGHTTDSYLAVPKAWIQSAIWVGFGLMALQALAELARVWGLVPDPRQTPPPQKAAH